MQPRVPNSLHWPLWPNEMKEYEYCCWEPRSFQIWFCSYLVTKSCPALCNPMDYSTLGSSDLHCLLEFSQIHHYELVMPSNHLILCCPFSSCLQSFPATLLFKWASSAAGGQSIGTSASTSVLPINPQVWFTLQLTGFIFLQFKGFSRVFSNTTLWKHQFFGTQPSLW